jgi:hypothetical protein
MPTPRPRHLRASRPRHLPARPRHLPAARWPWRLGLVALGLTTAVLAAWWPRPPCCPTAATTPGTRPGAADRPGRTDTKARTDAPHRPPGADHRAHPLGPISATVPPAVSRTTSAPGPVTAQAPATAGMTTITEGFSTVGATTTRPR